MQNAPQPVVEVQQGRPRKADGAPLSYDRFLSLFKKRAEVFEYVGGLWALRETAKGQPVLISSNFPEPEIRARFDLSPDVFIGFFGFRKGEGEFVKDVFYKPWLHGDKALQKLVQLSTPLESLTGIAETWKRFQADRAKVDPVKIIQLFLEWSRELPWVHFSLLLTSGREVTRESDDLSPALLKQDTPVGFVALANFGSKLFEYVWPVVLGAKTEKQLGAALETAKAKYMAIRPQPDELRLALTVDTMVFFRT